MSADGKIRIIIVEDHEMVRDGLKMVVNSQEDMEVVGEASDGHAAIELAREMRPDIVLMDISMPVLNGLKSAATLKRVISDVKILTLTRHSDESYIHELFQAGVTGYLLKQRASTELTRAIRTVNKGEIFLDPAIAGKVFSGYAEGPRLRGERKNASLTNREEEVLCDIAHGYSNREIADKLSVSVKTIETHKANAMQKLSMSTRRDIIRYAILKGWMQQP